VCLPVSSQCCILGLSITLCGAYNGKGAPSTLGYHVHIMYVGCAHSTSILTMFKIIDLHIFYNNISSKVLYDSNHSASTLLE
jgi:hypothetical protein